MKPTNLIAALFIVVLGTTHFALAEPTSEAETLPPPSSDPVTTNSVSTNVPLDNAEVQGKLPIGPFDQMDLDTLRQKARKLQEQLKRKLQEIDVDTDNEEISQIRDQLILADSLVRQKEAEQRVAERDKWFAHLEEVTTKLNSMKQERHGILDKLYQQAKRDYETGNLSFELVLAAEDDLSDAEFDLNGREAYKSRIQRLFKWQESLEASARTDDERERDYLKLKARYLKTYIDYLKGSEESYRHILEGYEKRSSDSTP